MSPDAVETWLAAIPEPRASAIRRIHEIVLGADKRLKAFVQNRTLTYGYGGDFAAFVQLADPQRISLMLNRGARIPGDFPSLEGGGPTARFLRFTGLADVEARADELDRLAKAWCALMAGGGRPGGLSPKDAARKAGRSSAQDKAKRGRGRQGA